MNFHDQELQNLLQQCKDIAWQKAGALMIAGTNLPGQSEAESLYRSIAHDLTQLEERLETLKPKS